MFAGPRFLAGRRTPLILQAEAAECGLACVAMIATGHGRATDLVELRQRYAAGARGANLHQLMRVADWLKLAPHPVRLEPEEIGELRLPCILHWRLNHFVVLERCARRGVRIIDPAAGVRHVRWQELTQAFSGVALELLPAADFARKRSHRKLHFRDLLSGSPGFGRSFIIVLTLTLSLQLLALLLPFYSQLVIDDVVLRGDVELLRLLALAFLLLVTLQALLGMCRAWIIVTFASQLSLQWTARVFRHLLRLPLEFFENRQVGDIQSRFSSLGTLQQLLTRQLVEALVDGLMTITTFAVMYVYQPQLALLVASSLLLYFLLRLLLFVPLQTAMQEGLAAAAGRENSFLETLRGMLPIKASGSETARQNIFVQHAAKAVQAEVRVSRFGVWQLGANRMLFGAQLIVVIWLGATAIIAGSITIGMLVAFLAYRSLFTERAAALIDRGFELRLARVQLERLADIVCSSVENTGLTADCLRSRQGPVTLSALDLGYRHGVDGPYVLKDVTLTIRAGEHVVITGPSGAGKSTLLKLLMGLLQPTTGAVLLNGRSLRAVGLQYFRRQVAAVMQNDQLFSGSLVDNITMFDTQPDLRRCRRCAWLSNLDDVIECLPLGYHTPAGDMGAALSGGQRQRLLLARALYRRPRILFLDEFSNHLDADSERIVHARLAELQITRVVVAHRQETIACADRLIRLHTIAQDAAWQTPLKA